MSTQRTITLLAAPVLAALLLAGCTAAPATDSTSTPAASESAQADLKDANAADEMFAAMMIPHHEQAIEMSDILLAKEDVDPAVADLAQRIKDAQGPEIELMQSWLEAWGSRMDGSEMDGMDHMGGGMMSHDDMTALEDADGPEASRLFLEQMIQHHEGAIVMAENALKNGENPDVLQLAQDIIDAQTSEIAEMKEMLGQG